MPNYELTAGDTGSRLQVTIKDSRDGEPVDLSGKTVELRYAINGGALQTKTMTVLDQLANKGKAEYQFAALDLQAGNLRAEVRLQPGLADQVTTIDDMYIPVKAPLA